MPCWWIRDALMCRVDDAQNSSLHLSPFSGWLHLNSHSLTGSCLRNAHEPRARSWTRLAPTSRHAKKKMKHLCSVQAASFSGVVQRLGMQKQALFLKHLVHRIGCRLVYRRC